MRQSANGQMAVSFHIEVYTVVNRLTVFGLLCLLAVCARSGWAGETQEERLQRLETQAQALLKEIDELKREMTGKPAQAAAPVTPAPKPVTSSTGIKISGYAQFWTTVDLRGDRSADARPDTSKYRRFGVVFEGPVGKGNWMLLIDPTIPGKVNPDGSMTLTTNPVLEAIMTQPIGNGWKLTAGQQRLPFSAEAMLSSATIDTVERAMLTYIGNFGMNYDIGLWLTKAGLDGSVALAVVNGAGISRADDNDPKDIATRLTWNANKLLVLGVSGYKGWEGKAHTTNDRVGADATFKSGPWLVRGELAEGVRQHKQPTGGYLLVGHRVNPGWQVVGRYDNWDPNRRTRNDAITEWTLGFNRFFTPQLKWQLNYVHRIPAGKLQRDMFMSNLQWSY